MELFSVTVKAEVLIIANSFDEAMGNALYEAEQNPVDVGLKATAIRTVERLEDVPVDWRNSIAYGTNPQEQTCEEYLNKASEVAS